MLCCVVERGLIPLLPPTSVAWVWSSSLKERNLQETLCLRLWGVPLNLSFVLSFVSLPFLLFSYTPPPVARSHPCGVYEDLLILLYVCYVKGEVRSLVALLPPRWLVSPKFQFKRKELLESLPVPPWGIPHSPSSPYIGSFFLYCFLLYTLSQNPPARVIPPSQKGLVYKRILVFKTNGILLGYPLLFATMSDHMSYVDVIKYTLRG